MIYKPDDVVDPRVLVEPPEGYRTGIAVRHYTGCSVVLIISAFWGDRL